MTFAEIWNGTSDQLYLDFDARHYGECVTPVTANQWLAAILLAEEWDALLSSFSRA